MSNTRDTNFFTQIFTNCCGEWLLVNEKNDVNDGLCWCWCVFQTLLFLFIF